MKNSGLIILGTVLLVTIFSIVTAQAARVGVAGDDANVVLTSDANAPQGEAGLIGYGLSFLSNDLNDDDGSAADANDGGGATKIADSE